MFDIISSNIDTGHGMCALTGRGGIYCGDHCPNFNNCTVKSDSTKNEEKVPFKMTLPNGVVMETLVTEKEKMQLLFTMGRHDYSNTTKPEAKVEDEVAYTQAPKAEQKAEVKEETKTEAELVEEANNNASDVSTSEVLEESGQGDDVIDTSTDDYELYDEDGDYDDLEDNIPNASNGMPPAFIVDNAQSQVDKEQEKEPVDPANQFVRGSRTSRPSYNNFKNY